jgi:hypothetical protein
MRENWKSFAEYLSGVLKAGWALASGTLMGIVLWAIDIRWPEQNWPYLPFVGAAVVFLLIAPYQVFHGVRMQRDTARGARLKPNLRFYDAVELVGGSYHVQAGFYEGPLLKLRQAAIDGEVQIWGKQGTLGIDEEYRRRWSDVMFAPYLPIPAEFWRTHDFYWRKGFEGDHHRSSAHIPEGQGETYVDLMLNRQQVTDPALKLKLSWRQRLYDRYGAWGEGGSIVFFAIKDVFWTAKAKVRALKEKLGIT